MREDPKLDNRIEENEYEMVLDLSLTFVLCKMTIAPQRLASRKNSHEKRKFWIHPLFSTKSYQTYLTRVGLIILESQMNPQLMLRENLVSSLSWSRS